MINTIRSKQVVGGYGRLWLTKADNHKLRLVHRALGGKKCHHFLFSEKIF